MWKKKFNVLFLAVATMLIMSNFIVGCSSSSSSGNNSGSDALSEKIKTLRVVVEHSTDDALENYDSIKFGSYAQEDNKGEISEPIEWVVLEKDEVNGKVLLMSKYILDCKCYNEEDGETTWENCTLRKWLNNDFYNKAFNDKEKKKIIEKANINGNNIKHGTDAGNNTNDKVFCLSVSEGRHYFGQGESENDNPTVYRRWFASKGTNYARNVDNLGDKLSTSGHKEKYYYEYSEFWLRGPGDRKQDACYVLEDGLINENGGWAGEKRRGVRPAIWVKY